MNISFFTKKTSRVVWGTNIGLHSHVFVFHGRNGQINVKHFKWLTSSDTTVNDRAKSWSEIDYKEGKAKYAV